MGRNINNVTNDGISLGDVTAARFLRLETWTMFSFFRVENTATDDRTIIAKWASVGNTKQFILRTDLQAAPSNLEIYTNNTLRITGGNNVALNTWYFTAVTNDGTGAANGLKCYLFRPDRTVLDDGLLGQHAADVSVLTTPTTLGTRLGSDPMDGDVAFAGYLQQELTKNQLLELMHSPLRHSLRYSPEWLLPLGVGSPEPDWSGKGNNGTVTGTTIGANPPIAPFFGLDLGWQGAFTAVSVSGRIMSSLARDGGLAGKGGIAGQGGGLAG